MTNIEQVSTDSGSIKINDIRESSVIVTRSDVFIGPRSRLYTGDTLKEGARVLFKDTGVEQLDGVNPDEVMFARIVNINNNGDAVVTWMPFDNPDLCHFQATISGGDLVNVIQ